MACYRINEWEGIGYSVRKCPLEVGAECMHGACYGSDGALVCKELGWFSRARYGASALQHAKACLEKHHPGGKLARELAARNK